jgi:transcription elongation factor Elf1
MNTPNPTPAADMAVEAVELLPCPFCGNAKNIAMANENHDHSGGYFIACPVCDASTGLRYAMGDDPRPLLIGQWNRRTVVATPAPSVPLGVGEECAVCGTGRAKRRLLTHKGTVLAMLVCDSCGVEYAGAEQMEYNAPPTLQAQDAAPVEPVAFVVRDTEGGSMRDFDTYYDADQYLIQNRGRMLKPQFLFCYEAPQGKPGAAAGVQGDAARRIVFDPDLYGLLMNLQNGIKTLTEKREANACIIRIDNARAAIASQAGKD